MAATASPLVNWVVEIDASAVLGLNQQLGEVDSKFAALNTVATSTAAIFGQLASSGDLAKDALTRTYSAFPQFIALATGAARAAGQVDQQFALLGQAANVTAKQFAGLSSTGDALLDSLKLEKSLLPTAQAMKLFADQVKKEEEKKQALFKTTGDIVQKQAEKSMAAQVFLGMAYGWVTGQILSWGRAGMQGTAEAAQLTIQMQLLSREIAGVFAPAIRWVIDKITQLREWFQRLTGDQQHNIRQWSALVIGALAFATILPVIITRIQAFGAVLAALSAHPVLALVSVFAGLLFASEEGRASLGRMFETIKPAINSLIDSLNTIVQALAPVISVVAIIVDLFAQVVAFVGPLGGLVAVWLLIGVVVNNAVVSILASVVALYAQMKAAYAAAGAMEVLKWSSRTLMAALGPIGLAIAAIGIIASLFMKKPEPQNRPRESVSMVPGGMESFEQTWRRTQEQIGQTDPAQRTRNDMLGVLREIRDNARRGLGIIPGGVGA